MEGTCARGSLFLLGIDLGEALRKVLLAARCALFPPANAAKEIAKMTHISRYRPGIVAAEVEAIS